MDKNGQLIDHEKIEIDKKFIRGTFKPNTWYMNVHTV